MESIPYRGTQEVTDIEKNSEKKNYLNVRKELHGVSKTGVESQVAL